MNLPDLLTQITPLETDSEQPLTKAYVKHASTHFPELVKALEGCVKCLTMDSDAEEDYAPEIKQAQAILARANEIKL